MAVEDRQETVRVDSAAASDANDRSEPRPSVRADAVFENIESTLGNKTVAIVILFVVLFALMGTENIVLLILAFVAGCVLVDRFFLVRCGVSIGGCAFLVVNTVGIIATATARPVLFTLDYLFALCAVLVAAFAACTFFVGRTLYEAGKAHGSEDADARISARVLDRLIDHPDTWASVDGAYPESETAINRVHDNESRMKAALKDEARRKDDLVAYLAHDLKTPLASVMGYLSLLEEAPDLPEAQRARFTSIALDKARRLDALTEEFFDITRFDFHDIVLTRGYVDLSLLLAQVVDEFYPALKTQDKHVELDVPSPLIVLVDGDKMARVFNNVMKNALAYSYEGSTVRISAQKAEDTVTIRFENRGDPIPEAKLKVIFEKFYRLDAARATNRGGAGLGLAIAREIVCAHGGTIACTSTPECTVFTIALPSVEQA